MHIHILGICGTFMGGIACLAAAKGYRVSGSDENVYPPMSTQLQELGIVLQEGYKPEHLADTPDMVVIGNALSRGNPAVEAVLNQGLPYQSGPQWLAENLLKERWVIAVAGTHGKTTTSSMIAWILTHAGLEPGFLIGGIPANFGISAKWGKSPFFVVEADEYDCAFFDKRSKFVHYHPRTCVMNNLEFDHADIFKDLSEIKRQFHHLVRTVPGQGALIVPQADEAIQDVLKMGAWSEIHSFGLHQGDWQARLQAADGSEFEVYHREKLMGTVNWSLIGHHNVSNALAAIMAAVHAGVPAKLAIEALGEFQSVKRRMEVRGKINEVTIYDDFAHHPTAIATTVGGLRAKIGEQRLIAVLDIRSNTMCMGTHRMELAPSLQAADEIYVYQSPKVSWNAQETFASLGKKVHLFKDTQPIIEQIVAAQKPGDHVLVMSNGGFDNLHQRLLNALSLETVA
ncbi:UDP-N-acetylmuramate:L-alanyl-gamma-D-glutamyl-meso-diaminopimelate ligase [Candidatus Berkiella aquae]|uniref:UDP-N-acetylmuramate--L-alanyl-gamma-D-glutamyl-meso-2,6-diaminoheptandioate ligase n=1 Tax=Candidatus Berkiella aquae TaxID=295108 RepID=A0A0Q9YYG8_9GAMM|nr:UDP-N-acetylmuramate:L-alanyl-gamma-D-glutamyl-meso-diaminopimelate ligase [Candidatus Berkiella aquae]MCS5710562.1 UDP-N-acetylmuramate:L-alanyl-gamma-D-glutamyl-meso-diaminopimelate ligase [Candidatus Berkiella aquae]